MASTFQPPIVISAEQDPAQQAAFINQNFQSLASGLETNSFRIVSQGVVTIPASGAATAQIAVTHNLGFVPTALAAYDFFADGSDLRPLPFLSVKSTDGTIALAVSIIKLDSTTIQFRTTVPGSTVTSDTVIYYYLLQQPAN